MCGDGAKPTAGILSVLQASLFWPNSTMTPFFHAPYQKNNYHTVTQKMTLPRRFR